MKKYPSFLTLRAACYGLCGVAALLSFVLPHPAPFILLTGAALTLAVELPGSRKWLKRAGLPVGFVVLLVASSVPIKAMIPVIDASSIIQMAKIWKQDVSTYTKIVQEVALAKQIYQTGMDNYQLATSMAKAIESKDIYAIQGALQMANSYVVDHYGESAGWSRALNTGLSIPTAYTNATLPMMVSSTFLSAEKMGSNHLAGLARIGISDDISQRAMSTVAQIAQQQQRNRSAVSQWQSGVYSANPTYNTAAAQQNLTNLGQVQLYEQGKASLAMNSILAQELTVRSMQDRDTQVRELNRWQLLADDANTTAFFPGNMEFGMANRQLY